MKVNTRLFGEIEVAEDRIITFTQGLMGFEEYTRYTLIYNSEKRAELCGCSVLMSHSLLSLSSTL